VPSPPRFDGINVISHSNGIIADEGLSALGLLECRVSLAGMSRSSPLLKNPISLQCVHTDGGGGTEEGGDNGCVALRLGALSAREGW